jgi:hypothetical protein
MARTYSEEFLINVHKLDADREGVKLAKACIKANLPAHYVADVLNVSRMTVHSWFRGKPIRDKNSQAIKAFMKLLDESLADGVLPATTIQDAKDYAHKAKVKLNTVEQ